MLSPLASLCLMALGCAGEGFVSFGSVYLARGSTILRRLCCSEESSLSFLPFAVGVFCGWRFELVKSVFCCDYPPKSVLLVVWMVLSEIVGHRDYYCGLAGKRSLGRGISKCSGPWPCS
ncbi:hypothetical protein Rs2_14910 [Raphanus sativus]|nr:hypothetical protein Rs2_14910 [Raphanus sativus]